MIEVLVVACARTHALRKKKETSKEKSNTVLLLLVLFVLLCEVADGGNGRPFGSRKPDRLSPLDENTKQASRRYRGLHVLN